MKDYLLLFLINPLLGVIAAIRSNSLPIVKNAIFIYIIFVGATFVISPGTDIDTYAIQFVNSNQIWFKSGFTGAFDFLLDSFKDSSELYMPIIIFIGSYFSDSKYLFTFLCSLSVGFAISNCYYVIRTHYITNASTIWNYLIIVFLFIIGPVWSINGRFWLAFWLFITIVLNYFTTKNIKYIFFAIPIILIHNGFILAVAILFFYEFTSKYRWSQNLYLAMIIIAFFSSTFATDFLVNNASALGGGYEKKATTYAVDVVEFQEAGGADAEDDGTPGFVKQRTWILFNALPLLILVSFFSLRKLKDARLIFFFNFILLFFSFVIFFQDIPSLGGRYWFVWSFLTILFFLYLDSKKVGLSIPIKYLSYGILFFCFYVGIRFELVQTSYGVIIGNPFILAAVDANNISIRDLFALFF